MKTKQEIIEETANYYNLSNRAVTLSGKCKYSTSDGRQCAVGRCFTDKEADSFCDFDGPVSFVNSTLKVNANKELDDILKEEYRGHSIIFWMDLQSFHDTQENWNDDGISEVGLKEKAELLEKYVDKQEGN